MTIEAQLEAQTKLLAEIRDLLAGGAAAVPAAAEAKTEKAEGKRTRKTTEKAEAKVETKQVAKDDLDDDLETTTSAAKDDLGDDLGDDGLEEEGPKYTAEQVKDALMSVKAKISKDKALEIMKGVGKSASVTAIAEENFDAVMKACEKALKSAK